MVSEVANNFNIIISNTNDSKIEHLHMLSKGVGKTFLLFLACNSIRLLRTTLFFNRVYVVRFGTAAVNRCRSTTPKGNTDSNNAIEIDKGDDIDKEHRCKTAQQARTTGIQSLYANTWAKLTKRL